LRTITPPFFSVALINRDPDMQVIAQAEMGGNRRSLFGEPCGGCHAHGFWDIRTVEGVAAISCNFIATAKSWIIVLSYV